MLSSTHRGLAGPEVTLKGDLAVLVIPGPGLGEETQASWLPALLLPSPPFLRPSHSLRLLLCLQLTPICSLYHLHLLTQQIIKGNWFGNHI